MRRDTHTQYTIYYTLTCPPHVEPVSYEENSTHTHKHTNTQQYSVQCIESLTCPPHVEPVALEGDLLHRLSHRLLPLGPRSHLIDMIILDMIMCYMFICLYVYIRYDYMFMCLRVLYVYAFMCVIR
jgi:hypothetical protein